MIGTFRSDLEPAPGAPLRLRRRRAARVLSWALPVAAVAATAVDLALGRPLVAALQLAVALAFAALLVRAELDTWTFDGEEAVRRTFVLSRLGFREVRLPARRIRRVGVSTDGKRARAWLETREGEEYALFEGEAARVEALAGRVADAVRVAGMRPPAGAPLH